MQIIWNSGYLEAGAVARFLYLNLLIFLSTLLYPSFSLKQPSSPISHNPGTHNLTDLLTVRLTSLISCQHSWLLISHLHSVCAFVYPISYNYVSLQNKNTILMLHPFSVSQHSPNDEASVLKAVKQVHTMIDKEIDAGISPDNIFVCGFSQGGTNLLPTPNPFVHSKFQLSNDFENLILGSTFFQVL